MRRVTTLLAAVVGLVGALLIAAPAQAATYGVSLTVNVAKADVGQTIKLTGAVSGSKAKKKTVLIQRRVGSGPWATIARPKTNNSKKYSFNHRVSAVGAQQFRVIAPKKGSTKQGASPVRAFTGWTWLWLTDQPHNAISTARWGVAPVVAGATRPRSIESTVSSSSVVAIWLLRNRCDDADMRVVLPDGATGTLVSTIGTEELIYGVPTSAGALSPRLDGLVTPTTEQLSFQRDAGTNVILASPRVHCSIPRLPSE